MPAAVSTKSRQMAGRLDASVEAFQRRARLNPESRESCQMAYAVTAQSTGSAGIRQGENR